jgi:hypothetical protein
MPAQESFMSHTQRSFSSLVHAAIAVLALTAAPSGCGQSHDTDDAGASAPHDAYATDLGPYVPPDTGREPTIPEAGFGDAGVHPAADVGPPGDGAGDTWTGYVESCHFASGSDAIRIVLDSNGHSGTVYFGSGVAPPPATDPNVGYPPGFTGSDFGAGSYVAEGFGYRFDGAMVSASRVQLMVSLGSLWAEWCSLQYPIAQDASGDNYGCVPNTGFTSGSDGCSYPDPTTHADVPVDCGRLAMCMPGNGCQCTATECSAPLGPIVTFDFHVTGTDGSGTVDLFGPHNVYLTR